MGSETAPDARPMDYKVRCPHCKKNLGDYLKGIYVTHCPGCKNQVIIDTERK